ncbi:hypothetical protein [Pedococcus sp. 2YAF34]|uniref:hypothetical protein n=1 Tax=Pedococcus sp. 2YAF34 TaxID=3233032 RepID=UPI003F9AECF6
MSTTLRADGVAEGPPAVADVAAGGWAVPLDDPEARAVAVDDASDPVPGPLQPATASPATRTPATRAREASTRPVSLCPRRVRPVM